MSAFCFFAKEFLHGRFCFFQNFMVGRWGERGVMGTRKPCPPPALYTARIDRTVGLLSAHIGAPEIGSNQSQRAPEIREQPRPKADKDRSGFLRRKLIIEAHFAGRKSLL